jgi:hypothetical protein
MLDILLSPLDSTEIDQAVENGVRHLCRGDRASTANVMIRKITERKAAGIGLQADFHSAVGMTVFSVQRLRRARSRDLWEQDNHDRTFDPCP